MNYSSENVIKLHSCKDKQDNHDKQLLNAIELMEVRREINNIKNPAKRVGLLALWKLEADKYWSEYY